MVGLINWDKLKKSSVTNTMDHLFCPTIAIVDGTDKIMEARLMPPPPENAQSNSNHDESQQYVQGFRQGTIIEGRKSLFL